MLRHAKLTSTSKSESSNLVTLSASLKKAYSSVLQALIDSGATLNFINEWIVTQLNLKTESRPSTRVTLADGRLLTYSARQVTLEYTVAGVDQRDTFLVAPIGDHSLILGMPWLERVNPRIDWRIKSVDANDFFHPPLSSPPSPSSPASPSLDHQDFVEAEESPLTRGVSTPHEDGMFHPHISSNSVSMESKGLKKSNSRRAPPIGSSNPPLPRSGSPTPVNVSKTSPRNASPNPTAVRISKGPPASAASPIPKALSNPRTRRS